MIPRFAQLPSSLRDRARTVRIGKRGQIPALLIHPNWIDPVPTMIWLHGRTANKELDAGRYVRWMKAPPPHSRGIAACAIDLPGHGERAGHSGDPRDGPGRTLEVLAETIAEIDEVIESLADPVWQGVFDLDHLGIGGMSLGGMATLRRLCDPHPFTCAAVESTTGDLGGLYAENGPRPWGAWHPPELIAPLDPAQHLAGFAPLPLLALHSESDRIIPISLQRAFLVRLGDHYRERGGDPAGIELRTWPSTGAPEEHSGFGRFGNDAKNLQTEFLARHLIAK